MKNVFKLLIIIIISAATLFAQNSRSLPYRELKKLRNELRVLKAENERLQKSLTSASQKSENNARQIEDLTAKISQTEETFETKTGALDRKIADNSQTSNDKVADLSASLSRNTMFWIIAVGSASILSFGLFVWVRRKVNLSNSEIENQIKNTQTELQEESIRLDNKLAEILTVQLEINEENQNKTSEIDHSLTLKIATEINRMQMNISHMDANVRGVKQLNRVLKNMINLLKRDGYEIVDLLGQSYNEGMNLVATMEPDEKLAVGQEVIKRIIVPQVNYHGAAIQVAEAVVGYGE